MGCQIAPSWNEVFNARLISAFSSDNGLFWNFDILISDLWKSNVPTKDKRHNEGEADQGNYPNVGWRSKRKWFTGSQHSAGSWFSQLLQRSCCRLRIFGDDARTSNERPTSWEYTLIVCFFESLRRVDSGRNERSISTYGDNYHQEDQDDQETTETESIAISNAL